MLQSTKLNWIGYQSGDTGLEKQLMEWRAYYIDTGLVPVKYQKTAENSVDF